MTTWAVIPARPSGLGKTRLAGVLDEAGRARLAEAMLDHAITAASAARNVDRVLLLGAERAGLRVIRDPGEGLNPALHAAVEAGLEAGVSRIVFVAGDLPQLTAREVELLAAAPSGHVAIAGDRHGTGTNALSLPLPAGRFFAFAFGHDSFALHHAEAQRLDLPIEAIRSPGLARDVDEPGDLADAADLMNRAG